MKPVEPGLLQRIYQQPLVWPGQRRRGLGLDADLLDGFQADAFARITAQSIGSTGYLVLSNG
jgi:hypothetical protein